MGFLIQRTGLVPKRLHWGIIAATMFTNFGDLPISIILAVSDHPPFLVGDGAKGTAYSSVFIAVFYLFLFPLGGYRLIRYDHVKESKRLGSLQQAIANGGVTGPDGQIMGHSYENNSSTNVSEITLSGDTLTTHPDVNKRSSPSPPQQQMAPSFSATSTMISMDYTMEDGAKEMRYRPHDHHHLHDQSGQGSSSASQSPAIAHSSPFVLEDNSSHHPLSSNSPPTSSTATSSAQPSPFTSVESFRRNPFLPNQQHSLDQQQTQSSSSPVYPTVQALRSDGHGPRFSVESFASNGTGATRHHYGHIGQGHAEDSDDHGLIQQPAQSYKPGNINTQNGNSNGTLGKSRSIRSPLFKNYQPPAFLSRRPSGQALGYSEFDQENVNHDEDGQGESPSSSSSPGGGSSSTSGSNSPYISLTPPEAGSSKNSNLRGRKHQFSDEEMSNIPLEPIVTITPPPTDPTQSTEPLPKVPPALSRSYQTKKSATPRSKLLLAWHWFWRVFHSVREYLTPPTIGLLLGLLVALVPHLRILFILPTPNSNLAPAPSWDELPPLSFILEVTLMLGGCCVPLGLTVLGASLSRLKPGRMRPLVPTLTMITFVKLFLSPLLGIMFMQMILIKSWGWVDAKNHMLQFTLMLMSGSPTSITCFVLAQVWDRRTVNAGGEMAAVIAVQYAVGTVAITIMSAGMMFYLF
ncbi:hypothetical protein BGZ83_006767 [Gryganskiella cystojenkinii]|nr:hypothetical protein BGZ83_006767 [Gryganskiella cystojenkinii]